jgi:PAS domain S-box-containing protein
MSTAAPSRWIKPPWIPDYAIAVLSVAAAIAADVVFDRPAGADPSAPLFLCAIMFVAWAAGTGPALLATLLTAVAFDYLFLTPAGSFVLSFKGVPHFALFIVAALFVVWLNAGQRRTAASLRRANETLRIENAERRRVEERARLAEQELQATIDTIPALAARHRADGTIDFVNQNWRNYTGLSQDEWKGRGAVVIHPDDLPGVDDAWLAHVASGEPFETEQRLRRADGEYRWHFIRRVPLRDDKGDVIAWYGAGYDIEDRKRAEDALRRNQAELAEARHELQLTIDSIPAMVSTYRPDGTYSFVNQTWINYTGMTLQEAVGDRGKGLFHSDDPERAAWRASLASGEPLLAEAPIRGADGEYRWHSIRRVPLRDDNGDIVKWYSTGFNVEDRKRTESALQRSEAYSAEAQKLSLTGSIAWDLASGDHFWSDETYQIMGFDRSIMPSIDLIMARVHPDDRARFQHEVDRAAQGAQTHDYEHRLLMPDGKTKHLHVRAHRVRYESGREEIVGAVMDITESRKSQAALDVAQTALAHASRVATLGEISASIAHEVNQPLAAIVANGQACLRFLRRETPDLDDVRGAVEWIVKDGNRAGEVIRRVRGLMKKADTEKVLLDINDVINEVAALLRRELTAQQVTLRLGLAAGIPAVVADRVQLQQVIINLVMNGIEAMQAITGGPHALELSSYEDEAHQVVVAVKDFGVGIAGETAERVFDAFFSTKPGGLGMGLSICRSIIEVHGGRLWSSTDAGPGATFQFALPPYRESAP